MKLRNAIIQAACVLGVLVLPGSGFATTIDMFTSTVGVNSPTQLGRLSRNNIIADWSSVEPYPGEINTSTLYHYTTYTYTAAQLLFAPFIQINFDSTSPNTFISAYLNGYDPTHKDVGYLGDEGNSGNFFGTDPAAFQVIVPVSKNLVLVVNTTAGGLVGATDPYGLTVEAFANTKFDDPTPIPAPIPEPSTIALLGIGLVGMIGAVRRRMAASQMC